MSKISCALTIAGTDPSGGAGIQADLKTFQELQSYGMSVITSVVAQNTTGVQDIHHLPLSIIDAQLNSVFSDVPVHALKTGMIANHDMMEVVYNHLVKLNIPIVIDPVMVATSGDTLINENDRHYLIDKLVPLAALVTPNLPETEYLVGGTVETTDQMQEAAHMIVDELGAGAALIKGGHLKGDATDYLYDGEKIHTFNEKRIDTINTHGTGCTYAAAITAYLSQGFPLLNAVEKGKRFITAAIRESIDIGTGSGPTKHWAIRKEQVLK